MKKFDVIVIGSGPGGYVAAIRAAQLGASVALVEKEYLGGTCLNWGCIPTKSLIGSAEILHQLQKAAAFGINVKGEIEPEWPAVIERKNQTVNGLRKGITSLLKANQVKVFKGHGSFESRRRIRVTGDDDSCNEILESDRVILASGSASIKPAFVPESGNIFDSRKILDLEKLPKDLIILGGGVIGSEFACMFARFGVKVTLVEMLPEILPMVDRDVAHTVRGEMQQLGIKTMVGKPMENIQANRGKVNGRIGDRKIQAEQMLICVGRRPYTDNLNLVAAGLTTDEKGYIAIDSQCRTDVNGIYAIGDITGTLQYAHRASAQGLVAAANAVSGDGTETHSDNLVPACIFTSPEIGSVGLTESEARKEGREINTGKFPFVALGKAQIHGTAVGFCKIITDRETDQVIGVQIVGPHATDLIAEATTAMSLEITADELGRVIHAHPTLAEATMEAAHAVHGQCIHMPPPRRKK